MLIFRWIVLLLLLGGVVCFAMYAATGEVRYRVLGVRVVKWAVIAGLAFFGVLLVQQLVLSV